MQIEINHEAKLIGLWLGKDEQLNDEIPDETKHILSLLKKQKYAVCIYRSGNIDPAVTIQSIVMNNLAN